MRLSIDLSKNPQPYPSAFRLRLNATEIASPATVLSSLDRPATLGTTRSRLLESSTPQAPHLFSSSFPISPCELAASATQASQCLQRRNSPRSGSKTD